MAADGGRVMKVTERVYFYSGQRRGLGSCSNSIVICGKKQILIDPGVSRRFHLKELEEKISRDGLSLEKTEEIWLTHFHPDHAQGASVLLKTIKANVRCHGSVKEILTGSETVLLKIIKENIAKTKLLVNSLRKSEKKLKLPILFRLAIRLPEHFLRSWAFILEKFYGPWHQDGSPQFFEKEEIFENDPDMQILFLPGHTPDEIGFYLEKEKILIIGDLLNGGNPKERDRFSFPVLIWPQSNFQDALLSFKKIERLGVEILIPGHGYFLKGERRIKTILSEAIARMERHKEKAKTILASSKEINIAKLTVILDDLPKSISSYEKQSYLIALIKSIKNNNKNNNNNKKLVN